MKIATMLVLLGLAAQAGAQTQDGKTVFAKNCAACHMPSGAGIPGAFPALKSSPFVQGDATTLIGTVLKGRAGMPTFAASLDDEKLAQVITYIRQSWGNKASAVSLQQVQAVRSGSGAGAVSKQDAPTNIH
jgi:cytochrome c6